MGLTIFIFVMLYFPGGNSFAETPAAEKYTWTLEDVKKLAESQNPDLRAAKANYEAVSATIQEAWSGYLPQVDATANFTQTTLPSPSAGSTNNLGVALPYSSAVATVKQTIFDFGKTLTEIGANKALANSAEQQALAVHNAVILSVQKAFYDVQSTQHLVDVATQGVAKFEETRRRMSVLVRTSARPSFDLSQANVELSRSKLNLISANEAYDLARISLLNIIGMPKEIKFELKDSPQKKVNVGKLDLDSLTKKALTFRPELKGSEYGVESAMMHLHREFREYLPTLGLQGWYGQYYPNYPTPIADAWGAGVTLTWNLFDGLKTTGKVREYSSRLEEQGAQLEKEKLRIIAEVAQSLLELKKSESNLAVAKETYDYAKENSRLAKRRYDANVATFLELITADTSLLSSQAVAVQAQYQYEIAIATMQKAVNAPLE
jgi:outer membrane protein TolC